MVSIIIPAFNVEKYIFRAIESCINQTYKNIEIIIIDDGSTDQTYKVILHYANIDQRICLLRQENRGVSASRNTGIEMSKGEYIIFLDADDWLEPFAIELLLINHKKNFLTCANYQLVQLDEDENVVKIKNFNTFYSNSGYKKDDFMEKFFSGNSMIFLNTHFKLFEKKQLLDNSIRFKENIYNGEDGLFVFEYLYAERNFNCIDTICGNCLIRENSFTNMGYSQKTLSAIDAADIILNYTDYDETDLKLVKRYYAGRAIGVKLAAAQKIGGIPCFDRTKINKAVKCYIREYLQINCNITKKIKALLIAYLPYPILRILLNLYNSK